MRKIIDNSKDANLKFKPHTLVIVKNKISEFHGERGTCIKATKLGDGIIYYGVMFIDNSVAYFQEKDLKIDE